MAEQNKDDWNPKIVAFLCNWCSYAGADLAGVSRMQYASDIRIIRVPCTGRISPLHILSALHRGADGVLVSGCHPGDCHYISGNLVARRKFALLKNFLGFMQVFFLSRAEQGVVANIRSSLYNHLLQLDMGFYTFLIKSFEDSSPILTSSSIFPIIGSSCSILFLDM